MSKISRTIFPLAGTAAVALGTAVFLLAPGRAFKRQKVPFWGRNIAHRGLHKPDKSVPENSLSAFKRATDNGYGIELDVQLSADDRVVVFHDDSLDRVCGVAGRLTDKSWEELRTLRLCGTGERMPELSEVFDAVAGRVPIVIELKRGPRNRELCRKTLKIMDRYHGPVCVESFDPLIVRWFRKNAPEILRGQLSAPPAELRKSQSGITAFVLGNLLTNFLGRPQFIAYKIGAKPLSVCLCEAMGGMKVAWTSRGWADENDNDMVIFEFCRPRRKFK